MAFLVMGSLNYDDNYFLDHIVMPGETIASADYGIRLRREGLQSGCGSCEGRSQRFILPGWWERQTENVSVRRQERMESRILFSEKKRVIPERPSSRSTRQARTVSYFLVEPIGSGRWNMWIRCWSIFRQKIF